MDLSISQNQKTIFREENFPFAVGVILLKHPWEFVEGETLPDIFDPEFEQLIESRAEAACPAAADDPLVMGYYYGFGAFNHSEHWVNHHLSLPPDSPGRNAIIDLLAQRYDNDVQKFNRIYDISLVPDWRLETDRSTGLRPGLREPQLSGNTKNTKSTAIE